ncbi:MAG: chromosomal replication initiator protein DnaA, partial [Acidobacteriota bacterium]|nr:chromosomal replication initiator protein DnaA [Acidobacteriota bacterium]
MPLSDAWEQIKNRLATKLGGGAYENWFSRTSGSLRDGDLTVQVPNETTEAWIRQEYSGLIRTAIGELQLPIRRVQYEIESGAPIAAAAYAGGFHSGPAPHQEHQPHFSEPIFENTASWLNPR